MFCLGRRDSAKSRGGTEHDEESWVLNLSDELDKVTKTSHEELLGALENNKIGEPTQTLLKELVGKEAINSFAWKYLSALYKHTVESDDKCQMWFQDIAIEQIVENEEMMTSVGKFICRLLPLQFKSKTELGDMYIDSTKNKFKDNKVQVYGTRDIFLWALLSYRLELAFDIFQSGWSTGDKKSLIGASLTACKVLNKLADIVKEIAKEKSAELESWARMYKTMATAITSLCFKYDANYTRQLVLHRRPQWGNQSFLVISSFLEGDESESFRIVLDDLWTGRLISNRLLTIKLILAIFPPLAIFLSLHEETPSYNLPARWRAYYTAPITKFMYNAMFFVFHLLAFSYFLMADFHHGSHWYTTSIWEKLVTLWVFGLLVEELRQMITTLTGNGIFDRFSNALEVLRSGWNGVDWIMLLLYVCGFIVRSTIDEERFYIARVLYTLSLLAMYIRFLRFATIWKYLGPKVEMIRLMMIRDLPPFLLIFVVYFISFGIAYRVLLFPNDVFSFDAVLSVFTVPFWQTFGEIQTEMTEGTPGCTRNITLANSNPDIERCPETQGYPLLVPILSGIFIIMSNILLLNILIAVFNQTYGTVGQESTTVHRCYQYSLVEEYIARPVLPPPLNMLEILIIRPLATLTICLYWSHTKRQDFRWGNHCWPLFILLMAGKEADPKLWKRVSEADKTKEGVDEHVPLHDCEQGQQSKGIGDTEKKKEITPEQIEKIFKIARNGSNIQMVNQSSVKMGNSIGISSSK